MNLGRWFWYVCADVCARGGGGGEGGGSNVAGKVISAACTSRSRSWYPLTVAQHHGHVILRPTLHGVVFFFTADVFCYAPRFHSLAPPPPP